jgi:hypothetical protein
MSTCNGRLHLQTLGSQPMMPKNLPDHCSKLPDDGGESGSTPHREISFLLGGQLAGCLLCFDASMSTFCLKKREEKKKKEEVPLRDSKVLPPSQNYCPTIVNTTRLSSNNYFFRSRILPSDPVALALVGAKQ